MLWDLLGRHPPEAYNRRWMLLKPSCAVLHAIPLLSGVHRPRLTVEERGSICNSFYMSNKNPTDAHNLLCLSRLVVIGISPHGLSENPARPAVSRFCFARPFGRIYNRVR